MILSGLSISRLKAAIHTPVALQLFSLRRQCEQDLEQTLSYVRQIGFDGVEFAGFYGRTAEQLKSLLAKNSLRCCGSHTPLDQLTGANFEKTVEHNAVLQNRYLIVPGLPDQYHGSAAAWKSGADRLNELADQLRPHGMRIGYHNHAIEFRPVDGVLPWALLFRHTRSDVILQLDTGNARIGGADPMALIEQYPGRAVTVHVKDYLPQNTDPVLGSSNFDWSRFLKTCSSRGATEWYIIEHDSPQRDDVRVGLERFRKFQSELA